MYKHTFQTILVTEILIADYFFIFTRGLDKLLDLAVQSPTSQYGLFELHAVYTIFQTCLNIVYLAKRPPTAPISILTNQSMVGSQLGCDLVT